MQRPTIQRRVNPGQKQRRFRERLRAYRASKPERPRRHIPRVAVPSFFTLMNLFCGFVALTQILDGRYDYACWLIVFAGFFDALDGMMARLTNGDSLFGMELDSLSDIVSFGIAPSFLVYAFALREFGMLGLIVSSLPALCGAVRLARFNVAFDGEKKDYFTGLPIPVCAAAIVALILNFNNVDWFSRFSPSNFSILIPAIVVLSGLMVSNIKFDAAPRPSTNYVKAYPRKTAIYVLGLLSLIFLHQIGLLINLIFYLFHGIGHAFYNLFQAVMNAPSSDGDEAKPRAG